jgi:hypothetical protein
MIDTLLRSSLSVFFSGGLGVGGAEGADRRKFEKYILKWKC